jgi:Tfp pilus assembly protein PilX
MLNANYPCRAARSRAAHGLSRPAHPERGVVLIVVLVVLVAMTLAAIALTRSTFTSNRIAGNLAFQQAATHAADVGIEDAIAWLEQHNDATLQNDHLQSGSSDYSYKATYQNPSTTQSWASYWDSVIASSTYLNQLPSDAAGNQVSFLIERLCSNVGAATAGAHCAISPDTSSTQGKSHGAGSIGFTIADQLYYRITVRVKGPRDSVSFVQAIVAL